MTNIFISYRREDSAGHVGRLKERLSTRLGRNQVFRDLDDVKPGEDFIKAINDAVASCDVLLAVIGKQWLTGTDAKGARRLDNSKDYVRQEIAAALASKTRVIPVLIQGTTMPNEENLPEALRTLAHRNAIELSESRWDYDVERLVQAIQKEPLFSRKALLVGSAALGVAVLSFVVYSFFSHLPTNLDKEAKTNISAPDAPQGSPTLSSTAQVSGSKRQGKLGDELSTPQWGLRIHNITQTDIYHDRFDQKKNLFRPQGTADILIVFDARLRNLLQKPQQPILARLSAGNTGLVDEEGHSYVPVHYDARRGDFMSATPILPGAVADFALVFSVPKGTKLKSLVLTLNDEMDQFQGIKGTDFQVSLEP